MSPLKNKRVNSKLTLQDKSDLVVRDFIGQRCVLGESLVVPLMILWQEYRIFTEEIPENLSAKAFVNSLEKMPWCTIENKKARGRFKSIIKGIGIKPTV